MKFLLVPVVLFGFILAGHFDKEIILRDVKAESMQQTIAWVFYQNGIPDREIEQALAVVEEESEFITDAVGDGGASIGIFQIHDGFHDLSFTCRLSVECSARYAAGLWKEGHIKRCQYWTAYRMKYCV